MASPAQMQQDVLSFLDAIMACIENYPSFNLDFSKDIKQSLSVSPISLLLLLIKKFASEEEIVNFIAKYIVYALPVLEIAIKGIILSNLKLAISCNIDPWIPDKWRQHFNMALDSAEFKISDGANQDLTSPIIPISTIDYRNILQINPITPKGKEYYFGATIEYTHQGGTKANTFTGSTYNEVYQIANARANAVNLPQMPEGMSGMIPLFSEDYIKSTGDISTIYELARAEDMNAFLWFVIHKGVFYDINRTELNQKELPKNAIEYSTKSKKISGTIDLSNSSDNNSTELYYGGDIVSTQYTDSEGEHYSTNYMLCYDGDEEQPTTEGRMSYYSNLFPCSNRTNSFNWYVNRKNYFGKNLGFDAYKKKAGVVEERDYDKELPICNMSACDENGRPTNDPSKATYFKTLVLPRPMLHYNIWQLTKLGSAVGENVIFPIPFKKILFDYDGTPNTKGWFTVQPDCDTDGKTKGKIKKPEISSTNKMVIYNLVDRDNNPTKFRLVYEYGKSNKSLDVNSDDIIGGSQKKNIPYYIEYKNGTTYEKLNSDNTEVTKEFINTCLFPCYAGLTVYEFNYDFVMSTKLFDAKTVAYRILKLLKEFNLGVELSLSPSEAIKGEMIGSIINRILNSDQQEISDCFFSFSNDDFATMLNDAEEKRAKGYQFEDGSGVVSIDGDQIMEILNEFDDSASLEEQVDVINNAFMQGANAFKGVDSEVGGYDFGMKFITNILQVLALAIFETIISPKMLLLFEVNRRIMGNGSKKYPTLEELLKQFSSLIASIIAAIMKSLITALFEFVMKFLTPILTKLQGMLLLEQLNAYKALILKIIENCTFNFNFNYKRKKIGTNIDIVQYADIDPVDKPATGEC